MTQLVFLFAWSDYNVKENISTYYGVMPDYTIYVSHNWQEFFAKGRCYCNDLHLSSIGEYIPNPDEEMYNHKHFTKTFIIDGNKIKIVKDSEIDFYENEKCSESAYFSACATYSERDSY